MQINIKGLTGHFKGGLLALFLALSFILAGLAPMGSASAQEWGTDDQHQLVPAYFYPDWWNPGNKWYTMCDSMNTSVYGSTAIMNPNSGPGTAVNSDYTEVLDYCHEAGHNVVGYVHTSYGARSINDVKDEIDDYYSFYPSIDGIFIDEMSNDSGDSSYYEEVYDYVHSKSMVNNDVIGNPGIAATTDWQLDTPVADEVVVFEGTASSYGTWTPPAWVLNKDADEIVQLVHAASNQTAMQDACDLSKDNNAGNIFITDDVLPNPWDTLPSYWSSEIGC